MDLRIVGFLTVLKCEETLLVFVEWTLGPTDVHVIVCIIIAPLAAAVVAPVTRGGPIPPFIAKLLVPPFNALVADVLTLVQRTNPVLIKIKIAHLLMADCIVAADFFTIVIFNLCSESAQCARKGVRFR